MARLLVALLLGLILGAAGMFVLLNSGAGDFFIAASPRVQELQRRLQDVELQRDTMTRRLEEFTAFMERIEKSYGAITDRFEGIEAALRRQHETEPQREGGAPQPGSGAPAAGGPATP
jgi:hypothetical protein